MARQRNRRSGNGGSDKKNGKKRSSSSGTIDIFSSDEKMMEFMKKTLLGGILFFVVSACLIVFIKRSNTKLLSPQDIMIRYVLTQNGFLIGSIISIIIIGKPYVENYIKEQNIDRRYRR